MSCIATFYTLPESLRSEFQQAKEVEKRTVTTKKMFFFTKQEEVGERYLWEYLDESNTAKFDFQYSGFLLVDYLWTYLQLDAKYFQNVDDYFMTITAENAKSLEDYLKENPIDEEKLSAFLTEDQGLPQEEHRQAIEAYSRVHSYMIQTLEKIGGDLFGILYLSF